MKESARLKRKSYFVLAAINILKEGKLADLTARRVASETGYNVASIYTYFKNLDHLENVASVYFTDDYVRELCEATCELDNPLKAYLTMWEIFAEHALKKPDYFYNVFFSRISQMSEFNLFKEYYSIFPHAISGESGIVSGMIELHKTDDREAYLLDMCVEEKIIARDMLNYIKHIHLGYFKFILTNIVKNKLYEGSAHLYHEFLTYFIYSMAPYVCKRYQGLLRDVLEFHKANMNKGYGRYLF